MFGVFKEDDEKKHPAQVRELFAPYGPSAFFKTGDPWQ